MNRRNARALVDANVFLSYLISSKGNSATIDSVVEAAFANRYDLLLPAELIEEITRSIETKPYFRQRVDPIAARHFLSQLLSLAELLETSPSRFTSVTRDPKDDYLLAFAVNAEADFLVTGDKDILVLGDLFLPLKIRTPSAFLAELNELESGAAPHQG